MEAITFSPAQVHIFNMVSHITSDQALEQLGNSWQIFMQNRLIQRWTAYGKLVNGISRSFNLSGVPISALLIKEGRNESSGD